MYPELTRDPQALLDLLRAGANRYREILAGVGSSSQLQVSPHFRGAAPYCFLVLDEQGSDSEITPLRFLLHQRDAEIHVLSRAAALDETLVADVAEKVSQGRYGLVVVLGVLRGEEGSWRSFFSRLLTGTVPSSAECHIVHCRQRLLEVNAMARKLRERLLAGTSADRIIEALHDESRCETLWDIARKSR